MERVRYLKLEIWNLKLGIAHAARATTKDAKDTKVKPCDGFPFVSFVPFVVGPAGCVAEEFRVRA
jgi:hypothetical protein